jgi:cytochrome c oxidase cbb3-type subunit III
MDPQEREDLRNRNITLLDHEYDGIQEFDQKLPNWWLFTLYITIVFSVIFWVVQHQWLEGQRDLVTLEKQLALVEDARTEQTLQMLNDDTLRGFAMDGEWVARGESSYRANCLSCHGASLEGGIGPSLVDGEWLHGSNPTDIFQIITVGVPEKGMQAWQSQLGPRKIAEVVAFVLSKQP